MAEMVRTASQCYPGNGYAGIELMSGSGDTRCEVSVTRCPDGKVAITVMRPPRNSDEFGVGGAVAFGDLLSHAGVLGRAWEGSPNEKAESILARVPVERMGFLTDQERDALEIARDMFAEAYSSPGGHTDDHINHHVVDMLLRRDVGQDPFGTTPPLTEEEVARAGESMVEKVKAALGVKKLGGEDELRKENALRPTALEWLALRCVAQAEGARWKATLRQAWETGDYRRLCVGDQGRAVLKEMRDTRGPSWLAGVQIGRLDCRTCGQELKQED